MAAKPIKAEAGGAGHSFALGAVDGFPPQHV
jgi:hypothetical protein